MIIVKTPLRISFAGGGTDLASYYQHDFGAVCSMAINKYIYISVNSLASYFPHRFRVAYSKTELVQDVQSIAHPIVRTALQELKFDEGGIDINVMADVPAGTGMGSSSAFTVALTHALYCAKGKLLGKEAIAREACRLEIDVLKAPIGKQDHYASAYGGINLLSFYPDEQVRVDPLPISQARRDQLLGNLAFFYLGGERSASGILEKQKANVQQLMKPLDVMREQAVRAAKVIQEGDLDELGEILREGWNLKRSLAEGITNPRIEEMMNRGLAAGALGGKLLGAGGTGFLLFYVRPEKREQLHRAFEGLMAPIPFNVDTQGTSLLHYGN